MATVLKHPFNLWFSLITCRYATFSVLAGVDPSDAWLDPNTNLTHQIDGVNVWLVSPGPAFPCVNVWLVSPGPASPAFDVVHSSKLPCDPNS